MTDYLTPATAAVGRFLDGHHKPFTSPKLRDWVRANGAEFVANCIDYQQMHDAALAADEPLDIAFQSSESGAVTLYIINTAHYIDFAPYRDVGQDEWPLQLDPVSVLAWGPPFATLSQLDPVGCC